MTSTIGPSNSARRPTADVARTHASVRAFTLLELILVMVIICSVLGLAAPSLQGFFAGRQTANSAAQILAMTQLARSLAVSEGRSYRLNFDTDDGEYWLTAQVGGAFERIEREYGRTFTLPDGVSLEVEDSSARDVRVVQFRPNGRQTSLVIRLTGRRGDELRVSCASPSEPFEIVDPEEEE